MFCLGQFFKELGDRDLESFKMTAIVNILIVLAISVTLSTRKEIIMKTTGAIGSRLFNFRTFIYVMGVLPLLYNILNLYPKVHNATSERLLILFLRKIH